MKEDKERIEHYLPLAREVSKRYFRRLRSAVRWRRSWLIDELGRQIASLGALGQAVFLCLVERAAVEAVSERPSASEFLRVLLNRRELKIIPRQVLEDFVQDLLNLRPGELQPGVARVLRRWLMSRRQLELRLV